MEKFKTNHWKFWVHFSSSQNLIVLFFGMELGLGYLNRRGNLFWHFTKKMSRFFLLFFFDPSSTFFFLNAAFSFIVHIDLLQPSSSSYIFFDLFIQWKNLELVSDKVVQVRWCLHLWGMMSACANYPRCCWLQGVPTTPKDIFGDVRIER